MAQLSQAATHPALVSKLLLVASGPFESGYAGAIMQTRLSRMSEGERARAVALLRAADPRSGHASPGSLAELGKLLESVDSYAPIDGKQPAIEVRQDIYESVWPEADEMRRSGHLLRLGQDIRCPVVAIHGDYDSHPAAGVEEPLSCVVQDFRFVLVKRCGHTPWIERHARDDFLAVVEAELS